MSSADEFILINFDDQLQNIIEIINKRKAKTISFSNFLVDQIEHLLANSRIWLANESIHVERLIFVVRENHLLEMERLMIKYFPPCFDSAYYNEYWEKEREWLMNKRTSENFDNMSNIVEMHFEWRKRLEEALDISKEKD